MPDSLLILVWCAAVAGAAGLAHLSVTAIAGAEVAARVRFTIALIGLLMAQYLLGLLLVVAGVFGRGSTWLLIAGAGVALAALLRSSALRAQLLVDLRALQVALQGTHRAGLAASTLPALLAWLQATRGVVTPPLDWDFLTYHGPRAAFWLQESRLWPSYDAVGQWQSYSALPPAGDLITAWAMSMSGDDLLVAPTWTGVWLGFGLASYAAARSLEARRWHAVLAAVAVALLPAAFHHMSSGYIDNAVALSIVGGATCLVEAERRRSAELASFGLLGFAMGAALKHTALPFALIAFVLWLRQLYRVRPELGRQGCRVGVVLSVTLAALVTGLLWFGMLLIQKGNPMYPFAIDIAGLRLPGARDVVPEGVRKPALDFVSAGISLFYSGYFYKPWLHNGFSPGGLLLMVGALGTVAARRRTIGLAAPALLLGGVGVLAWVMRSRIGAPGLDDARYLVSVSALAAIVVASASASYARVLLVAAIVIALVYALPWRWARLDALPLGSSVGIALLVLVPLYVARRKALGLALALVASLCCAAELRSTLRWEYYRAAAEGELMASGPISICPSSGAHRIWQELAQAPPLTLDVSAGNHPLMTHWYIYPLLGDHFQHRLIHVRTGLHFPEQRRGVGEPELERTARAWSERLQRGGAGAVLLYKPFPIEAQLVARVPGSFADRAFDTPGATLFSLR